LITQDTMQCRGDRSVRGGWPFLRKKKKSRSQKIETASGGKSQTWGQRNKVMVKGEGIETMHKRQTARSKKKGSLSRLSTLRRPSKIGAST